MKKIFIVLAILLMATAVFAADLKSVGNTADAAITTGSGYLKGIIISTDSANSVTFAVYDNTAASGSKLFSTLTVTTSTANRVTTLSFDGHECPYSTGIYVDITTAGSVSYDVYFESN
jgi:hypothetical protein